MVKRARNTITILFIFIALLMTGCKGGHNPELVDTSWTLDALNGAPPVSGSTITLEFTKGRISGTAGCNSYDGTYTTFDDNIQITNIFATMSACMDEAVQEQETVYLETLALAVSYELVNSRLFIYDGAGSQLLVFTRQAGQ